MFYISFLGRNKKLGLSGRKSRDVGILSTSKLYSLQDKIFAFTPQVNIHTFYELHHLFVSLLLFLCFLLSKRKKAIRIEGYVNNIVPKFSARQFKEHFRMTPNCFSLLENKLSPMLLNNNTGRPRISPRVQLLAVLWLLATPDSYR